MLQLLASCTPSNLVHAGLWDQCACPSDHHRHLPHLGSAVLDTAKHDGHHGGDLQHMDAPQPDPSAHLASVLAPLHGLMPSATHLVDAVVATYLRWSKDEFNPAAIAVPFNPTPAHDGLPAAVTNVPDLPPGTELAAAVEAESHAGSAVAPGTIAPPHPSSPSSRPASDPRSVGEALSGAFGPPAGWLAAMEDELKRLINDFQAFVPVSRKRLPRGARPIPTTWVFQDQAYPAEGAVCRLSAHVTVPSC